MTHDHWLRIGGYGTRIRVSALLLKALDAHRAELSARLNYENDKVVSRAQDAAFIILSSKGFRIARATTAEIRSTLERALKIRRS